MEAEAPESPYRAANQPTGGDRKKNGGGSHDLG